MPYNAGTAYLQVIPSFRDIEKNIVRDLNKVAKQFGDELEKSLPKALKEAFEKASKDAGNNVGKAAENIAQRHADAVKRVNENAADETVRRDRETAKKQGDIAEGLATLRRKRAELALREFDRFRAQEIKDEERAEAERAKILDRSAQDRARVANAVAAARQKAQAKIAADILRSEEQLAAAIEKAHEDAFREQMRRDKAADDEMVKRAEKRMEQLRKDQQEQARIMAKQRADAARAADEAFRRSTAGKVSTGVNNAAQAIQNIPAKLNFTNVDGEMQRIRQKLDSFKGYKIGVNIDVEDFVAEAQAQFERLRQISRDINVDIDVRTDAAAAATELGGVLVMLNRLDGKEAEVKVDVDADSARARLAAMASTVDVNLSRLGQLIAVGAALGSAIVPAAAVATGAIGAIGTAAIAAAVGAGVLALAFGGVSDAVKALSDQADDVAKNNRAVADSEAAIASAVDGVNSARRALANTIENNRQAAIQAAESVADAERALAKARRDAVRDAEAAERALAKARRDAAREAEDSERRVAQARERAAEDAVQAARRVADAQRALQRDEENAKRAREELTEAYKDAYRTFEELTSKIKHNALDQQTALLDIAEAKENLDKLLANPRATEEERERARIAYEERKLQYEDLITSQNQMAEDYDDFAVEGVENSKAVEDAQRRVADADRAVAEGRQQLVDAQKAQTKALIDGQQAIADAIRAQSEQAERSAEQIAEAERRRTEQAQNSAEQIADAERRLAKERRDQQNQARQAAFALASAQQSLVSAQRSLASAYRNAGEVGAASVDKVNEAMQNLSPTAREFARFIFGLKDEFYQLRASAADGVLSGLQKAITMMLPYLPAINDFVRKVGNKLGQMFVDFATALKEPVFQEFFDYIKRTAIPTMDLWFQVGMNLLKGFIGLFMGFTPLTDDVSGGILDMSKAFADWATNLKDNKGFQEFLGYVRENGPRVMEFFGSLIKLGWRLLQAMAPIGVVVLEVVDGFVSFLASIPPDVLMTIVAGVAALAAAISIMGVITSALAISTTAWIIGAVVAVAAIGVALWTLLFTRVKPLREFFIQLWRGIVDGAKWLWAMIQPILADIGRIIVQLWRGAFVPAFKGIWELIQQWWAILKPIFGNVGLVLKAAAAVVVWLWNKVFKPNFQFIADLITKVVVPVIRFLYNNVIKPVFYAVQIAVNVLSAAFKVGFGAIQIAFKILSAIFGAFYRVTVKPWLDPLMAAIKLVGGAIAKWIEPYWKEGLKRLGDFWKNLKTVATIPIRFIVEVLLNKGILAGYNKLADMFDVDPKNVQIPPPRGGWATGGVMDVLPGYSPGVDNHTFYSPTGGVIGLSGGEGILRPEVTALVRPWLDGANKAAREGGRAGAQKFLGGFKNGGVIPRNAGDGLGDFFGSKLKKGKELWNGLTDKASDVFTGIKDFASDPGGYLKKVAKGMFNLIPGKDTAFVKALASVPRKVLDSLVTKVKDLFLGGNDEGGSGTPGSAGGLGGSAGMMRILRAVFPGLPLISGFRPGAITATGNPSYHGKNRAVDLPPRMDVFNWIRENYRNSREIIFSPAGQRQIHNGRPHVYSGITKRMHYNHVHWAYDKGGWLPDTRQMPGQMMSVFHGRRQPDAVLSNGQWDSISRVARQAMTGGGGGRGDTYNFDFEKSALTADRLSSIQARRDTRDRISRPNR